MEKREDPHPAQKTAIESGFELQLKRIDNNHTLLIDAYMRVQNMLRNFENLEVETIQENRRSIRDTLASLIDRTDEYSEIATGVPAMLNEAIYATNKDQKKLILTNASGILFTQIKNTSVLREEAEKHHEKITAWRKKENEKKKKSTSTVIPFPPKKD